MEGVIRDLSPYVSPPRKNRTDRTESNQGQTAESPLSINQKALQKTKDEKSHPNSQKNGDKKKSFIIQQVEEKSEFFIPITSPKIDRMNKKTDHPSAIREKGSLILLKRVEGEKSLETIESPKDDGSQEVEKNSASPHKDSSTCLTTQTAESQEMEKKMERRWLKLPNTDHESLLKTVQYSLNTYNWNLAGIQKLEKMKHVDSYCLKHSSNVNIQNIQRSLTEIDRKKYPDLIVRQFKYKMLNYFYQTHLSNCEEAVKIYQSLLDLYPTPLNLTDKQRNKLKEYETDYWGRISARNCVTDGVWLSFPFFNLMLQEHGMLDPVELTLGRRKDSWGETPYESFSSHLRAEFEAAERKAKWNVYNYKSLIYQEYQIHLMPKPEWMTFCVEKLLKGIRDHQELREAIYTFKIALNPYNNLDHPGKMGPLFIIYPQLGKEKAQTVLKAVSELFDGIADSVGSQNKLPFEAYFSKGFISYTQGDILNKMHLHEENPDSFARLFEKTGVHYLGKEDYALQFPS